jgi:hypothetical protein
MQTKEVPRLKLRLPVGLSELDYTGGKTAGGTTSPRG